MGFKTNIIQIGSTPPIQMNILPGESNQYPKNLMFDANKVWDLRGDLLSQIDEIKNKTDYVAEVADIEALNQYDTSTLKDGDIIKVTSDSDHDNAVTYYKWNEELNQFEYAGTNGVYYSKAEIDKKINDLIEMMDAHMNLDEEEISIVIP